MQWLALAVSRSGSAAAAVLGLCACLLGMPAFGQDEAPKLPQLTVQLALDSGQIAIDSQASVLDLGDYASVYQSCGLDREGMKRELIAYLAALTQANGKLLTQLAMMSVPADAPDRARERVRIEAELEQRARTEADTGALWAGSQRWADAAPQVHAWAQAMRQRAPRLIDADRELADAFELLRNNPALADGPLLAAPLDPDGAGRLNASRGIAVFQIAPPLVHASGKLRPTANVAQWDRLRRGFGDDALKRVECRLWYRARLVSDLQDYAAVRGIALQTYRTQADVSDSMGLAAATDLPSDRAAIRPERPEFRDKDFGGRIHLDPDPLLEAVYVRGDAADSALVERVLYLLLPSTDFDRVRSNPQNYLCRTDAFWAQPVDGQRPPAVQLPLDPDLHETMPTLKGPGLAVGRIYMTRRELALRLQRLAAIGHDARLDMAHAVVPRPQPGQGPQTNPVLRLAILIVEPRQGAAPASLAGQRPPFDLQACRTPRDPAAALPVCTSRPGEPACAAPLGVAERAGDPTRARQPLRNHVEFSAEHRAGKPVLWGASYRHQGLQADDRVTVGLGQQRQASGDFSYSKDFVGFGLLNRRMQVTARAYSAFDPLRGIDATRPDERRNGAGLRLTVDLWRDLADTFAQAELGLSRTRIDLTRADAQTQSSRVTLAEAALVVVRSDDGTRASAHQEAVLQLAGGRGFSKAGLEGSLHRFVGAFEQWDLRVRAHAVSDRTPLAEYVSFGGEDTVRGYAADRTVARRVWAVQNEVWMPLPWRIGSDALQRTLRRKLALAPWLDIGGASESPTAFSGRKTGVGIGLRYNHEDALTLRLDVARPVGAVDAGDRHTRFHFTLTTRRFL